MKTYISGPMTGLPNYNRDAFNAVAKCLRAAGYEVVNPAEVTIEDGTWEQYMRKDLKEMLDCDRVMTLSGWKESAGAQLEVTLAHRLGIEVTSFNAWLLCSSEALALGSELTDELRRTLLPQMH